MQAGAHEEEHNASHPRHEVAAGRIGPRQVAQLRLEELAGRGHLRAVHAHHAGDAGGGRRCRRRRSTTCTAWTTATTAGGAAPGASSARTSSSRRLSSRCRQSQVPVVLTPATQAAFIGVCPANAPIRCLRHHRGGSERRAAGERQRDGPGPVPERPRRAGARPQRAHAWCTTIAPRRCGGQTVLVDNPAGGADIAVQLPTHQGPIHDPTALALRAHFGSDGHGDLTAVTDPTAITVTDEHGNAGCRHDTAWRCPAILPGIRHAPIEPLVLRANAGDCITVTLRNRPAERPTLPDLATFSTLQGVVKRDRLGAARLHHVPDQPHPAVLVRRPASATGAVRPEPGGRRPGRAERPGPQRPAGRPHAAGELRSR